MNHMRGPSEFLVPNDESTGECRLAAAVDAIHSDQRWSLEHRG